MISNGFIRSVLLEALDLIRLESNWSKDCCASRDGEQCAPWDLHANRWSCFGAIEKVLIDRDMYRHLLSVVSPLEEGSPTPLLHLDYKTSHGEVVALLANVIDKLKD